MIDLITHFEGKLRDDSFSIPIDKVLKNRAVNRYYDAAVAAAKAAGRRDPEGFARSRVGELMEVVIRHLDKFVALKGLKVQELSELLEETLGDLNDLFTGKNKKAALEALKKADQKAAKLFDELGRDVETSLKDQIGDPVTTGERLGMLKGKSKRKWTLEEGDVIEGGKKVRRVVRAVKKLKGAEVELQRGPGGRLRFRVRKSGEPTWSEFYEEFDVFDEPYRNRPRSTEVMQAHHGCQSALMREVFGDLYDPGEAPTIWMRDSTSGSPHRIVSDLQEARLGTVKSSTGPGNRLTYEAVRDMTRAELRQAGAPEAAINKYLKAIDEHVRDSILTKKTLSMAEKRAMVGNVPGVLR